MKKHRWHAWDSNQGWQDGRRRQIHWAMAAPLRWKFIFWRQFDPQWRQIYLLNRDWTEPSFNIFIWDLHKKKYEMNYLSFKFWKCNRRFCESEWAISQSLLITFNFSITASKKKFHLNKSTFQILNWKGKMKLHTQWRISFFLSFLLFLWFMIMCALHIVKNGLLNDEIICSAQSVGPERSKGMRENARKNLFKKGEGKRERRLAKDWSLLIILSSNALFKWSTPKVFEQFKKYFFANGWSVIFITELLLLVMTGL